MLTVDQYLCVVYNVLVCQRVNVIIVCQYVSASVSFSAFQGHCVRGFVTVLAPEYTHKVMSVFQCVKRQYAV